MDLVCLDETRAELLGLAESEVSFFTPPVGPEVVRFDSLDAARVSLEMVSISEQPIQRGRKVSDVWKERFRLLASVSKFVIVVDRYAGENLCKKSDGLARFIRELDGAGKSCQLAIFTASKDFSAAQIAKAIQSINLARGGVREIEVNILDDRDMGVTAHDRFVRFDETVCEIGTGVEVFNGTTVYRDASFSFKMGDAHRETEKRLRLQTQRRVLTHNGVSGAQL